MAIITKPQLLELIQTEKIQFAPAIDGFQIQPASIDLRIGWSFYIPYTWKYNDKGRVAVAADYLDYSSTHENYQLIKLKPGQYFEILPNESIIASTLEKITLQADNLAGFLAPRSSAARRGLSIESGMINPLYSGHLIIPMRNNSHHVLKIYPGERLCQIIFHQLSSPMTSAEAAQHGLQNTKYDSAAPYNLNIKLDDQQELDLLRKGDIDGIKKKFIL